LCHAAELRKGQEAKRKKKKKKKGAIRVPKDKKSPRTLLKGSNGDVRQAKFPLMTVLPRDDKSQVRGAPEESYQKPTQHVPFRKKTV